MDVRARPAQTDDLSTLTSLYRSLEKEMTSLHEMWALADGLAEPVEDALEAAVNDVESTIVVGLIDDAIFGFLLARVEALLPQARQMQVGSIRLVFVEMEAREVGVGEAMLDYALADLRRQGLTRFDAHVLPGHRLAKNFFEAGGFAARAIIMHHVDGW
ncbi:MAG: GNAT family N-acetyltransferase [Actinomycetota bacterium]